MRASLTPTNSGMIKQGILPPFAGRRHRLRTLVCFTSARLPRELNLIARYTRPEMGRVWSEENRFQKWLEVELAASETLAEAGIVPREAPRNYASAPAWMSGASTKSKPKFAMT